MKSSTTSVSTSSPEHAEAPAVDARSDDELLRTGCVDPALFDSLRQAYADPARGPAWVRARLVPLVTRLYIGSEIKLHDPWRSAPIDVKTSDEFRSWVDRYFGSTF